jgi:hypothetical protein
MSRNFPIILGVFFIAACNSDKNAPTAEVAAEDSVLAHDVLAAWGDSTKPIVEERVAQDDDVSSGVTGGSSTRTIPQPALKVQPASRPATVATTTTPPPATVAVASPSAPAEGTPSVTASESAESSEPPAPKEREERSRGGSLSRGATLSVVTTQSVCSNHVGVGDTFRAELVAPVSGTNGLVIPAGASAVAEVTSLSEWGAGIGVRITSVHYDGRAFPVKSHVAYVVPESGANGACIPRRTRLETEI